MNANFSKIGKIFLVAAALLVTSTAVADDSAILKKIAESNAAIKSFSCTFNQMRVNMATGTKNYYNGHIYYAEPEQLAIVYSVDTEQLIINRNQFYLLRAGKPMTFNTDKNAPMRSLSNTLQNCLKGNLEQIAKENNADIEVATLKNAYQITFKAKKRAAKGYESIVLKYNKTTCMLQSIQLNEFNGNSQEYMLKEANTKATIDSKYFVIPKK